MLTLRKARKRVGGKLLVIHCPTDIKEALDRAAEREMVSASAYARRAIRDRLQAEGRLLLDEPTA
jgi:hypothetical protein